jgi:hypothetical protein
MKFEKSWSSSDRRRYSPKKSPREFITADRRAGSRPRTRSLDDKATGKSHHSDGKIGFVVGERYQHAPTNRTPGRGSGQPARQTAALRAIVENQVRRYEMREGKSRSNHSANYSVNEREKSAQIRDGHGSQRKRLDSRANQQNTPEHGKNPDGECNRPRTLGRDTVLRVQCNPAFCHRTRLCVDFQQKMRQSHSTD